jgi:hypothetical protein
MKTHKKYQRIFREQKRILEKSLTVLPGRILDVGRFRLLLTDPAFNSIGPPMLLKGLIFAGSLARASHASAKCARFARSYYDVFVRQTCGVVLRGYFSPTFTNTQKLSRTDKQFYPDLSHHPPT